MALVASKSEVMVMNPKPRRVNRPALSGLEVPQRQRLAFLGSQTTEILGSTVIHKEIRGS